MTDFKKLAAEAFKRENIEIIDIPKVRATLCLDDLPFATGQAEVANDGVSFFPEPTKHLDNVLHGAISLRVSESANATHLLSHSQELFDLGTEMIWFFVYRL